MPWYEYFRIWASLVISAASLFWIVWWSIRVAKGSAAKSEQDKLIDRIKLVEQAVAADERMDNSNFATLTQRLQAVEGELRHLPTRDQFNDMKLSIAEMKADFRELAANIRPLAASVERIDDFLMERAKQ